MLPEQEPPNNFDAEMGIVGALLRDNAAIPGIAAILQPQHFYQDAHQKIFKTILDLQAAGAPANCVTVYAQLKQRGLLEDAGGGAYLYALLEVAPTAANAVSR